MKHAGRSARVPRYTADDVSRIYGVRGAIEGLAAQLPATTGADLAPLEAALGRMEAATAGGDVKELVESDLALHLALGGASGNPLLLEILKRLLRPLFTFVLLPYDLVSTHTKYARSQLRFLAPLEGFDMGDFFPSMLAMAEIDGARYCIPRYIAFFGTGMPPWFVIGGYYEPYKHTVFKRRWHYMSVHGPGNMRHRKRQSKISA